MEVNIAMMLFPDASILFVCYAGLVMVDPIAPSFRFELHFGTWQSAVLRRRLKVARVYINAVAVKTFVVKILG
jgi:hypothetical protein